MDNWKQFKREDLHNIPMMIEHGYQPVFNKKDIRNNRTDCFNPPHEAVGFVKDKGVVIRIWQLWKFGPIKNDGFRDIISYWRSANIINNRFTNHASHNTLEDALKFRE